LQDHAKDPLQAIRTSEFGPFCIRRDSAEFFSGQSDEIVADRIHNRKKNFGRLINKHILRMRMLIVIFIKIFDNI